MLFPAGTILYLALVTAARDGERSAFDIGADPGDARPLGFGAGMHHCLGANVARAELEEALRFLARELPEARLAGEPEYATVQGIYGLTRLPLRWG